MKNFYAKRQTQNKKSYSRILFFGFESRLDQESRWFNRRNFWKKVDQTLYKINTYHSPHVNHAWKWPQKLLCGPPWPSFFIDFRNLSSDLTRRDRKKTWTGVPTALKDLASGIIRPSWPYKSVLRIFISYLVYELWSTKATERTSQSRYIYIAGSGIHARRFGGP